MKVVIKREAISIIVITTHWVAKLKISDRVKTTKFHDKTIDALNFSLQIGVVSRTLEIAPEVLLMWIKMVACFI